MIKFIEILNREIKNLDRIYIYPEQDGWCAYEQSACRLSQLTDDCRTQKVINRSYQIILIRTILDTPPIHDNEVSNFLFKYTLHLHKEGYMEILVPRQSEVLFELWKIFRLSNIKQVIEIDTK